MIRDSIKNEILNSLNFSAFRMEDFLISYPYAENIYRIIIEYDEYFFYININVNELSNCIITYCPGIFLATESIELPNLHLSSIVSNIHLWIARIEEEEMSFVQRRYFDKELDLFREKLNDKLDKLDDSYFTKTEGEELRERLNALEELVKNKDDIAKNEIYKMQTEIIFLRSTIDTLTKKKWIKNALTKILVWGQNPENQTLIENSIKTMKAITQVDLPDIMP